LLTPLCNPKGPDGRRPWTPPVDALFTATSSVCVTGLIVRDTGSDWSGFGQLVILGLIQIGGLGIMTIYAFLIIMARRGFSIRFERVLGQDLEAQQGDDVGTFIRFICQFALLAEVLGAVALYFAWRGSGNFGGFWHCAYHSVFHSISAFCNAGFGLFSDSLMRYDRQWQVYAVICPLIILGGLGFGVLYNLTNMVANRVHRYFKKLRHKQLRLQMEIPKRMRLQTKIVLSVSAVLIVLGTLAILIFEQYAGNEAAGEPDLLGAFFQSVMARTAGFNTVDIAALTPSSKIMLIMLMFIGGSPGSTAGGIKTVTLAVIIMTVVATLRKRSETEMFRRSVRRVVVGRAITVTLLFLVVLFITTLALSVTESPLPRPFQMADIMFEAASALGTVGLSTGVTPTLTYPGKVIIIVVMLIGRLGPLTLLAALTFDLKTIRYNYPDEAIIVG